MGKDSTQKDSSSQELSINYFVIDTGPASLDSQAQKSEIQKKLLDAKAWLDRRRTCRLEAAGPKE